MGGFNPQQVSADRATTERDAYAAFLPQPHRDAEQFADEPLQAGGRKVLRAVSGARYERLPRPVVHEAGPFAGVDVSGQSRCGSWP